MKRLISFALAAIMIIASLSMFVSAKEADEITGYEFSLAMDAVSFFDSYLLRVEGNHLFADDFFSLAKEMFPGNYHEEISISTTYKYMSLSEEELFEVVSAKWPFMSEDSLRVYVNKTLAVPEYEYTFDGERYEFILSETDNDCKCVPTADYNFMAYHVSENGTFELYFYRSAGNLGRYIKFKIDNKGKIDLYEWQDYSGLDGIPSGSKQNPAIAKMPIDEGSLGLLWDNVEFVLNFSSCKKMLEDEFANEACRKYPDRVKQENISGDNVSKVTLSPGELRDLIADSMYAIPSGFIEREMIPYFKNVGEYDKEGDKITIRTYPSNSESPVKFDKAGVVSDGGENYIFYAQIEDKPALTRVMLTFNADRLDYGGMYNMLSSPACLSDLTHDVSFKDVPNGIYYYLPVLWAVEKGITEGTSKTTFSPDSTCTRGQIVTFLWRAAGKPLPVSDANPFKDVKASDYFYSAVLWAVEKGITTGMSETSFAPNSPCTRGQTVTFLWRAAGKPKLEAANNPFNDVKEGDYFYDAVLWAVGREITKGTSSTSFSPSSKCSRGQIVTFLYRSAFASEE